MYSLYQLSELVKNAHNMIEIEGIILTEVFNRHSCTFAKHVERPNGNQSAWVSRVCLEMGDIMKYDRRFLFDIIPERFKVTRRYINLNTLLNSCPVS